MFGYVRPFKAELTFRDFARYRSAYCGLCQAISRHYGQLPRMAVSYDLTFLILLLESVAEEEPVLCERHCPIHPLKARAIEGERPILHFAAALTVLLACGNLQDDLQDGERRWRSGLSLLALRRARKKAARDFPQLEEALSAGLGRLRAKEQDLKSAEEQAESFGALLGELARQALEQESGAGGSTDGRLDEVIPYILQRVGAWIFLLDAADDYEADLRRQGYSLLPGKRRSEAVERLRPRLQILEEEIEKAAALLPYKRDARLIANIVLDGLASQRESVLCPDKRRREKL